MATLWHQYGISMASVWHLLAKGEGSAGEGWVFSDRKKRVLGREETNGTLMEGKG